MIHIISLPVIKLIHSSIKLKCVKNSQLWASVTMEISASSLMDLMNLLGFQRINILERKDAQNIGIKVLAHMGQDANLVIVTLKARQ